MAKRKGLTKKVRFEVFKRDSFTCQYCGRNAPDVVLEVDHISPVAKGGSNELTNLVTSCFDCNSGKSDRELSDSAVVKKQMRQLDEMNERRQQIEMIAEYHEWLRGENARQVDLLSSYWAQLVNYDLTDTGRSNLLSWLKKYSFKELIDAINGAAETYLEREPGESGGFTFDSICDAFERIPRICSVRRRAQKEPWITDAYYIRGILRNRFDYVAKDTMELLSDAFRRGADADVLKRFAVESKSWTKFRNQVYEYQEMLGEDDAV